MKLIWIVLAALGVPLWLIFGALGGALWSRRQFKHAPGVFPCKIRIVSGSEGPGKWTRSTAHALWVHDVLLVHVGLALVRSRALPVAGVDEPISPTSDVKLKGDDVLSARLRLDDGSVVEIAGPRPLEEMLMGPFADQKQATTAEGPTA